MPPKIGFVIDQEEHETEQRVLKPVKRSNMERGQLMSRMHPYSNQPGQDFYNPDEYEMESIQPENSRVPIENDPFEANYYLFGDQKFRFFRANNGELFARTDQGEMNIDDFFAMHAGTQI